MKFKNNHWYSLKFNVHLPSNRRKKENITKYMAKKLVRKVTVFLLLSDCRIIRETLRN